MKPAPLAVDDPLAKLAIFGGEPAFAERLHIGRPNIGDRARLFQRFEDMLNRRWLTNAGPFVRELEARLAALVGVRHCIAMCNATVALEIASRALDLSGEVIVPSFTFVATAHALQWQRITPVFADVDPATHTIDPAQVERLITPRTTGILGVHLWGRGCDVAGLEAVAARHGLKVLYDAAHALGCSRGGRLIGGFGNAEVFSFHATKLVNSFEGGAVATNDDELARKMRLMKNFGFRGYDDVCHIGVNGKMNEAAAAMGLTSLESMDEFVAANRANYHRYRAGLAGVPGVRLIQYDERERNTYPYIVLEIDAAAGVTRDQLVEVLHAENVLARRYFYPGVHRMEPYRTLFPTADLHLPHTRALTARVVCLPTGTAVSAADIDVMTALVRMVVAHGPEIAARLGARRRQGGGSGRE